ncbi:MAG TPA: hypothetical protein VMX57_08500, partial [Planctomycetota bacterium]|nr:hypothetical protein [Planctomycetota bacterium]
TTQYSAFFNLSTSGATATDFSVFVKGGTLSDLIVQSDVALTSGQSIVFTVQVWNSGTVSWDDTLVTATISGTASQGTTTGSDTFAAGSLVRMKAVRSGALTAAPTFVGWGALWTADDLGYAIGGGTGFLTGITKSVGVNGSYSYGREHTSGGNTFMPYPEDPTGTDFDFEDLGAATAATLDGGVTITVEFDQSSGGPYHNVSISSEMAATINTTDSETISGNFEPLMHNVTYSGTQTSGHRLAWGWSTFDADATSGGGAAGHPALRRLGGTRYGRPVEIGRLGVEVY